MPQPEHVHVSFDYRCPYCPDHRDEMFFAWEGLLEQPVCDGCITDILTLLLSDMPLEEGFPTDIAARMEAFSGRGFPRLRLEVIEENLAEIRDPAWLDRRLALTGSARTPSIEAEWRDEIARMEALRDRLTKASG
ncbi:MAG: hypothetical protein K2Q10_03135 [Rhodospirillales bacterium]|nr:hypothetical protein [Rhodospirillales bacterium]